MTTTSERILAAISYLSWILYLIAFFFSRDSQTEFLRVHFNQAFNLNLLSTLFIMFARSGMLPMMVLKIISAAFMVFLLAGILFALMGKSERIPVIGSFAIFK